MGSYVRNPWKHLVQKLVEICQDKAGVTDQYGRQRILAIRQRLTPQNPVTKVRQLHQSNRKRTGQTQQLTLLSHHDRSMLKLEQLTIKNNIKNSVSG